MCQPRDLLASSTTIKSLHFSASPLAILSIFLLGVELGQFSAMHYSLLPSTRLVFLQSHQRVQDPEQRKTRNNSSSQSNGRCSCLNAHANASQEQFLFFRHSKEHHLCKEYTHRIAATQEVSDNQMFAIENIPHLARPHSGILSNDLLFHTGLCDVVSIAKKGFGWLTCN